MKENVKISTEIFLLMPILCYYWAMLYLLIAIFESYLGILVGSKEDDIRLILGQYIFRFIT